MSPHQYEEEEKGTILLFAWRETSIIGSSTAQASVITNN
jgi:hypothetical protein